MDSAPRTPSRRVIESRGALLGWVWIALLVLTGAGCAQDGGGTSENRDARERQSEVRERGSPNDTVEQDRGAMYDVIVYLTSRASEEVQTSNGAAPPPDVEELRAVLEEHGTSLEPLHAGADDPNLARQFRARVEGRAAADEVAEALRAADAVEGAYVQPPQGPPG